jgi:LysR family transcriptional regulator for metE and metH
MKLEIRHLKLVCAVADEGSVTRAAHRLHVSQSALSHQLRDAEENLKVRLFERSGRKMTLTAAGTRLLRSAKTILEELSIAEKEIEAGVSALRGRIRLTTECCTVYYWLPPILKIFERQFPGIDVEVVVEPKGSPFQALLEGELDLIIACNPVRNRLIEYIPLFDDENVLIVANGHPLANKSFIVAEDLKVENLLVYPPKDHSSFMNKILVPAKVSPRRVQEIMLTESIIEMVRAGLGVASLCRWIVAPHLKERTIRAIPITPGGFWRAWSVARIKTAHKPAAIAQFLELLTSQSFSIPGGHRRLA